MSVAACIKSGAEAERDRKQESPWRRGQIWNCHTGKRIISHSNEVEQRFVDYLCDYRPNTDNHEHLV